LKKYVQNFEFGDFVIDESDDLQSKKNETGSVRIDFSRSVIFNLFQRVLQEEIRFFTKNLIGFLFNDHFFYDKTTKLAKTQKNPQKLIKPLHKKVSHDFFEP